MVIECELKSYYPWQEFCIDELIVRAVWETRLSTNLFFSSIIEKKTLNIARD